MCGFICGMLALNIFWIDVYSIIVNCVEKQGYRGPKPFRVLNCWFLDPKFAKFVDISWRSLVVRGRAVDILKEKLKKMKFELKRWNKDCFGGLQKR